MRKIQNEQLLLQAANPLKIRAFAYNRFTYPWHFHAEMELLLVDEGEGRCIVGDRQVNYGPGDLLLFGSNLPHCMQNPSIPAEDTDIHVRGVILQLEKDFMQPLLSMYTSLLPIHKLLQEDAMRGILFHLQHHAPCRTSLYDILECPPGEQLGRTLLLLQQLTSIPEKSFMASPQYDRETIQLRDRKIQKIIAYLNKHYVRGVSLTEAASQAAMNPSAFCRYFKEATGKTLKSYIMDMRIGYAGKLLADPRLTIGSVSAKCGFESVTHFNRVFKQITGCTPSQFREQLP